MRSLVRRLDEFIAKQSKIFKFTQEEDCILRLQVDHARHTIQLPEGSIEAGEPVLQLHMWNDHLSHFSTGTTGLAWARQFLYRIKKSLCLVADYLHDQPQLDEIRAVGGMTILLTSGMHEGGAGSMQRLGFTIFPYYTGWGRFGEFWENFYSWLVIWTYNPGHLPTRSLLKIRRSEMWMSRDAFLQRFG